MIDHGLKPIINDGVQRNTLRLPLLPSPPAPALTDITNGDRDKPPTPAKGGGAAALTQEERDSKTKAEGAARALAALDAEDIDGDETPASGGGKDDPPDGVDKVPRKAPSAKERRAAVAIEKKKDKEAKAAEAKAQKEAKKAEKAAAKASGGGGKRKREQVCVA